MTNSKICLENIKKNYKYKVYKNIINAQMIRLTKIFFKYIKKYL